MEQIKSVTKNQEKLTMVYRDTYGIILANICYFTATCVIIGVGVLLKSDAMQWLGFLVLTLSAFVRVASIKQSGSVTIEEAKKWLDEMDKQNKP